MQADWPVGIIFRPATAADENFKPRRINGTFQR